MRWEDLREEQFQDAIHKSGSLCVVPISALEKNGQHLPVGATGIIMKAIIEEAMKLEDVMVFSPSVWLGEPGCLPTNAPGEPANFKGTVQLSQKLQNTVFAELCNEISRNGFKKILVLSLSAGWCWFLSYAMGRISYEKRDFALLTTSPVNGNISSAENVLKTVTERRNEFPMITDEDIKTLEKWAKTGYGEGHANFCHTSLLLAIKPELVAKDKYDADSGISTNKTGFLTDMWGVYASNTNYFNYPDGKKGYAPHGCTESIGEALLKINAEHLAKIFKFLKEDKDCLRMVYGKPKPRQ